MVCDLSVVIMAPLLIKLLSICTFPGPKGVIVPQPAFHALNLSHGLITYFLMNDNHASDG